MTAQPNAQGGRRDTGSVSDLVHLAVLLILSALPPAAAAAFPPDVLEDKNQLFITLYFLTLPWSLAVSTIVAGLVGGWFGEEQRNQFFAVAAILFVSAIFGGAIAPGSPFEEHFRGAPPLVMVLEIILFVVAGYALLYGWPMWAASFLVAAYVGWWVHEKMLRDQAPATRTEAVAPPRPQPWPTRPPDDLATLPKAELYERARRAGIEGRSKMSKEELVTALRARRT